MPRQFKRWLKLSFVMLLAFGIVLTTGHSSLAQFSLPEGFGQSGSAQPPAEVSRIGNLETAPVLSPVNRKHLFTVASPTVYNRSDDEADYAAEQQPVEKRAEDVRARLLLVVSRPMDPKSLVVRVSKLNNVTVIVTEDQEYTRPLVLVSVTAQDADFNGVPIEDLAEEWRDIVEEDLRSDLNKLPQQVIRVIQIAFWLLVITGVGTGLKYVLWLRQKRLYRRKQALSDIKPPEVRDEDPQVLDEDLQVPADQPAMSGRSQYEQLAQRRTKFLHSLRQIFSLDRQLRALDFLQWLLFWLLVVGWYIGLFWLFSAAPVLARYRFAVLRFPLQLLAIWFFTGLAIRISRRLVDRFATPQEGPDLTDFIDLGDVQRSELRVSTIAGAIKGLVSVAIAITGLLMALRTLGIPTGSVLAITGLLGLAVSFGSQNLVRDLVNGFLILAEDQYAIGDVIDLGHVAGLVENLNLRVTQLRSAGGELITIPNSAIAEVKNLTRSWSRVPFSIDVAYHTDPQKALSVLQETAQGLYEDPEWHDKLLAPPEVLGIDSISHSGMTLTVWLKTAPGQQWSVGRTFRLRIRQALEENGIEIGVPRQTYTLESPAAVAANGRQQRTSQDGEEAAELSAS